MLHNLPFKLGTGNEIDIVEARWIELPARS